MELLRIPSFIKIFVVAIRLKINKDVSNYGDFEELRAFFTKIKILRYFIGRITKSSIFISACEDTLVVVRVGTVLGNLATAKKWKNYALLNFSGFYLTKSILGRGGGEKDAYLFEI